MSARGTAPKLGRCSANRELEGEPSWNNRGYSGGWEGTCVKNVNTHIIEVITKVAKMCTRMFMVTLFTAARCRRLLR